MTLESVQALLNSEDYGDRLSGVNQLRDVDPPTALEMIKPLITDSQARVRYSAVSIMDTVGNANRQETLALLRDRLLTDSEVDVRAAAADAIAALKFTEAFEDLRTVYHETEEWLLQFSIVAALGEMGDERGFELLQEAIQSDNNLLQTAAISSFGELGDPRAIPLLLPFLEDQDWQIRHRLAQALSHLGGEEARACLEKLAQDELPQVAEAAKRGLGNGHW
ncbi:HEAT repeat domain-containing protein [Spirulina sp. CS-785/01]|uniref:phycobilisome degradation protein NblB n=1 Tax=Spirulina sp. CS-785/01 TaxID=3021716 RepID=UPI00232F4740|nr:HEAT repeat domain-containing protein [Spirulina sp. CS-785/01]MDB9314146.1 HEAT repeat domain-containing protein [Spirulina sp. CS-785/01]